MALSSFSFLIPLPQPDAAHSFMPPCSRPCSISAPSPSLWVSRAQYAVRAGQGKSEKMDFLLDDDDSGEDTIPEHIVDMEEWMRNRPAGFGVGKEYDLALEEKLLADIEADKKAREAAKVRAKTGKGKITPKARPKVTEAPAGVEVWVGNLPRKRKVERDLRAVFRDALGLLHIRPIVEPENEKTREPLCRGFAFLTFATEDDAYGFVSQYNGEKVKFGKVDKRIACEVAKSDSPWHPNPNGGSRASSAMSVPRLQVRDTHNVERSNSVTEVERELEIVSSTSSVTSKSSVEEREDAEPSEIELRALEEEIWDQFEDEDDMVLDLELAEDGSAEDESTYIRSAVYEDETPAESVKRVNAVEEVGDSRVSVRRETLDVDEEEYSVEKIKELEAKLKEMERKLQLSSQNQEERVELLEKRLLSKAKAATGVSTLKIQSEKKKAAAKKNSQSSKKSQKPKVGSLGSASRLKAKERAILTGVMSKCMLQWGYHHLYHCTPMRMYGYITQLRRKREAVQQGTSALFYRYAESENGTFLADGRRWISKSSRRSPGGVGAKMFEIVP